MDVETREDRLAAAAEDGIDALIERRARECEEQARVERAWASSARRFGLAAQAERRRQWINYHNDLARLHSRLVEEHEAAVRRLIDEGAISG